MLGPSEIRRLIPHDGAMCLLEHVLAWDADTITCRTRSHRAADHPLAHAGRIGALCGIEYGLQAMAVHGALSADRRQPIGYLVRLGDVALTVEYLDELGAELVVQATLVQAVAAGYSYEFTVSGADAGAAAKAGRAAIRGRATIALVG